MWLVGWYFSMLSFLSHHFGSRLNQIAQILNFFIILSFASSLPFGDRFHLLIAFALFVCFPCLLFSLPHSDILWSILAKFKRLSWFRPFYSAKRWEKDCWSWKAECTLFSLEGRNASPAACYHRKQRARCWTLGC